METYANTGNPTRRLLFVVVLALIAAMGVGTANRLPEYVAERLIETDGRVLAHVWEQRVLRQLQDPEAMFSGGILNPVEEAALNRFPQTSEVFRFSIFDSQGQTIWASAPEDLTLRLDSGQISQRLQSDKSLYERTALAGDTQHKQLNSHDLDGTDHTIGEDIHQIMTITQPIFLDGHFSGAIRFCTDITAMRQRLIDRLQIALMAVVGVALCLMLFVVWVVYSTGRSKVYDLKLRAGKERELMEDQIRLAREVRLLGELNEWLQSSRSLDELFKMVAHFMTHILPDCAGSVYVYSPSRDVLDGSVSWNEGQHLDHIHPEDCWGLRRGRTYIHGYSEVGFACSHVEPHDGQPYFCFPILAHGETVGLMHLKARIGSDLMHFRDGQRLAQMCAEQISMAIANVQMRDQLQDQSIRDPLTGLFNRRHMTETLRRMMGRSQKNQSKISLVSIDVDHFKKFNDSHGHDAGDMVLRSVGIALEQHCDGDEIACRMGGEEFMLLLPQMTGEEALKRAEQLRLAVENSAVRYGEKTLPRVTISVGIAVHPDHGVFPQDVMRAADDALYEAKANGRNQVVLTDFVDEKPRKGEADLGSISGMPRPGLASA